MTRWTKLAATTGLSVAMALGIISTSTAPASAAAPCEKPRQAGVGVYGEFVDDRSRLADDSRDSHLTLRRVERQQVLIERLVAARGRRLTGSMLAAELGVSARTVSRDVERLTSSGVPIRTWPGRCGGISLPVRAAPAPVSFDLVEAAAVLSSLTVLGPTATGSAGSAMRKLTAALSVGAEVAGGHPVPVRDAGRSGTART